MPDLVVQRKEWGDDFPVRYMEVAPGIYVPYMAPIVAAKATYRASTIDALVPATTTDEPFFLIEGSATKIVTVTHIAFSGITLTAREILLINLVKYSSVANGGTFTTLANVPLDSEFAASTATVKAYTVAPSGGTSLGAIASRRLLGQTTAPSAEPPEDHFFDFGTIPTTTGVILRGASQGLALSWGIAPASVATLAVDIEWTED